MEWTIEHIEQDGIIKTVVNGAVGLEDVKNISREVFSFSKQQGITRLLSDYRNASLNISVSEVYELPETFKKLGRTPEFVSAVVFSADSKDKRNYDFYDTRCFNSAVNTRVFTDYDRAYQWLASEHK